MARPDDARANGEAASLLARMLSGKRETREGSWPGRPDIRFTWVVLSNTEIRDCAFTAWHEFASAKVPADNVAMLQFFQDEVLTQILARAMRDPENTERRLAKDVTEFRDLSTADVRAALYDDYVAFQQSVDPRPESLSPELADRLVELLKKKDGRALSACASFAHETWLLTSDDPPSISPTPNSLHSSG